jgi:hypothetical protein
VAVAAVAVLGLNFFGKFGELLELKLASDGCLLVSFQIITLFALALVSAWASSLKTDAIILHAFAILAGA